MKHLIAFLILTHSYVALCAQDTHITRKGKISFFSHTNLEDITAVNNEVVSTINTKTGNMQFLVLIKGFQFKKAAMQQHFNSKEYMSSDMLPKSDFKGVIKDVNKIDFTKDGSYNVVAEGALTMHGVTNKVTALGTLTIKDGKLSANTKFAVKLADYKITVPSFTYAKIAEIIEVSVLCSYEPYKN